MRWGNRPVCAEALRAQAAGYAWALNHADSARDIQTSRSAYWDAVVVPGGLTADDKAALFTETWQAWRVGAADATGERLSAAQIAELSGFNVSYIKAEIARGSLPALLIGNSYLIRPSAYREWADKPRRGSRSKRAAT